MKFLKTIIAAVLFEIGTAAIAQGPVNRPVKSASEHAKRQSELLVKYLDLSQEQTIKVRKINLNYAVKDSICFSEIQKKQQATKVDRETMMRERQNNRSAKIAELKAILTDTQRKKYETLLKEMEKNKPPLSTKDKPKDQPEKTKE